MKIGFITDNNKFGESFSRRIAELSQGIELIICSGEYTEEFDVLINEKYILDNLPVTTILAELGTNTSFSHVRRSFPGDEDKVKVWCIRSPFGGSGCTAAATVLARILAGRCEGNILLVHTGKKRLKNIYTEETSGSARPSEELEYLLEAGEKVILDRYCVRDRYGVCTIETDEHINVLTAAAGEERFRHIIVDLGNYDKNVSCNISINVIPCNDCRAGDYKRQAAEEVRQGSAEFFIFNKADYKSPGKRIFYLPDEPESFRICNDKIEITMDGAFASIMAQLAETADEMH